MIIHEDFENEEARLLFGESVKDRQLRLMITSPGSNEAKTQSILSDSVELGDSEFGNPLDSDSDKSTDETYVINGPSNEDLIVENNIELYYTGHSEYRSDSRRKVCLEEKEEADSTLCKCPLCHECFSSNQSFTEHIRQHNNSNSNDCQICGKILSSSSSLDRHMLTHSRYRPFKCKMCEMAFTTNGNMHRHMRTHVGISQECAKSKTAAKRRIVENESSSLSKKRRANDKETRCTVCDKILLVRNDLQGLMRANPNDLITCLDCRIALGNNQKFVKHPCLESGSSSGSKELVPIDKSMVGFHDMIHLDFTSNNFSLVAKSFCERDFRQPSSAFHNFKCQTCDRCFPSQRVLALHEISHTDNSGTYCFNCNCNFKTPAFLHEHQLLHKRIEHCCPQYEYGKQLHSLDKSDFMVHLKLKNKSFQNGKGFDLSNIDGENFENSNYFMYEHSNEPSIHTENVTVVNKSGGNSSDLADIPSIISTSNTLLMPYIRSPVTATAASPPQPQTVSTHPESPLLAESVQASPETPLKEDPDQSSYEECSDESNKQEVDEKPKKKAPSQSKSYYCPQCSYTSSEKSTLNRHLKKHTGERLYQCSICDYAFTTKANCERHVMKLHDLKTKEEALTAVKYNSSIMEPNGKGGGNLEAQKIICKFCGQKFLNSRILRHHLRSINDRCKFKPYLCKNCEMGFSTKNNCLRHITNQHKDVKDPNEYVVRIYPNSSPGNSSPELSLSPGPSQEFSEEPLNLSIRENPIFATINEEHTRHRDVVDAAESLVSLSEVNAPQEKPLDLTVHPVDLTGKQELSHDCDDPFESPEHRPSEPTTFDSPPRCSTNQLFECKHCPSKFTIKSNRDRHIKNKHPDQAKPIRSRNYIPNMTPGISGVSDETRNALRSVLSNKNVSCSNQEEGGYFKELYKEDNKEKETADLASIPDVIDTANNQEFRQFLGGITKEEKMTSKSKNCNKGSSSSEEKTFTSKKGTVKKRSSYSSSSNSIICPFCQRKFPWRSSLRRHLLTHTGQKPYKCSKCPIQFSTKSNCERHIVRKHNTDDSNTRSVPERSYKCNQCPSSKFATQNNLKKHHSKHLAITNSKENGKFENKNTLIDISNVDTNKNGDQSDNNISNPHTSEAVFIFCCHICRQKFETKGEYCTHLQYHSISEWNVENPKYMNQSAENDAIADKETICCAFCSQLFTEMDNYSDHMTSHLAEMSKVSSSNKLQPISTRELEIAQTSSSATRLLRNRSPNSMLSMIESNNFISPETHSKQLNEDDSDLIQNLLGIHDAKIIDQMLDSADSAARLLGVEKE